MKSAADVMKGKIEGVHFKEPSFKVINNVTATLKNPEILKKLLVEQIFSTVRWRESIIKMSEANVKLCGNRARKSIIWHGQKNNKRRKMLFN